MESSVTAVPVRPHLRGLFHLYACLAFAGLGVALVASAPGPRERLAAAVFGGCLVLTFGVSALYHRVTWSPTRRTLMRSADHAAIYLLIAGTYTPYGLLVLRDGWRFSVLGIVWTGAILAIAQRLVWRDAPKWLPAAAATALGWVGIVAFPQIAAGTGLVGTSLILVGGLFYTLGAVVYVLRRPDPLPSVFGYHELFHVFTIVAAACQYAAVAFFVLR
jgi:hemolysin III